MTEALRILVVDDDEVDRIAVRRALADAGEPIEIEEHGDGHGVVAALGRGPAPDCVVLDYHLPGRSGIEVVREVRAAGFSTPIVMVTGREDAVIADALAAGATDFLHKSDLSPVRVLERVRHAIRLVRAERESALATARREAELGALRRAVRTRDQLLDLAGHDLRNPLHSMAIALSELAQPELPDAVRAQYIAAARRSVDKMERLVRDVLDLGHLESGTLSFDVQPTSITWLVEQIRAEHASAAAAAGTPLEIAVEGDPGDALLDPARTRQAIGKVIGNVIRHAKASGPATIRAARVERDGRAEIEIKVSDRGPGFPATVLQRLDDRASDGPEPRRGPGMGLALAQGLVAGQAGTIAAGNRAEAGAEVWMRFPAAPPADDRT